MKKLIRAMFCTALLTLTVSIPAFAAEKAVPTKQGDFYVLVNGQYVTFPDAVPELRNDRSCLPFVAVLKELGFAEQDMTWDGATKTVTAIKGDTTIALTIGQSRITLTKDKETTVIDTDVAPYIDPAQSRAYVPLGLVADALGYHVGWDGQEDTVIIDDVNAILAANQETYAIMDKYMAYSKTFYEQNQKITGKYDMGLALNTNDGTEKSSMGFTVDGTYEMLTAGVSAFQFNTDMSMDVTAMNGGEDVLSQVLAPKEQEMFPLSIDMDMRGDMSDGNFYFQSTALSKLMEQPEMANAWFKLDLAAIFDQMGDTMGIGYSTLMELSMNSLNVGFEESLVSMLKLMPLTSAQATTADCLNMINDIMGDSAFQKTGTSYVSTMEEDGMVTTFTLYTNGSKVTGYTMGMTAADPAFGKMKMTASMMNNKMEMVMGMDMTMAQDQGATMSVTLDMTMDGTYQATTAQPATQPPADAVIVDLMSLMG